MFELVDSMAWPFAACLVLTGIHVYLGIHVIERRVVFVDLALAQIAALGTVWGVFLGWSLESDPWTVKGISLGFTFIGAAVFSLTRTRRELIPHEAIIGIIYAVALAATVLATAHLAHGAEEVRDLLSGSILWVRKETVIWSAVLYSVIGAIHWFCRKPFFELSMLRSDSSNLHERDLDTRARLWDFFFYVTFGFVVTSSVAIGGVLLVFTYLVIPAVAATMFATRIRTRLIIGWTVGTIVSAIGVIVSYRSDLPSGPTIVVCFGIFLALAGVVRHIGNSANKLSSVRSLLLLVGGLGGFLGATWALKPVEHNSLDHRLTSADAGERLQAILMVVGSPELSFEARPYLPDLLVDTNPSVRRSALELVVRRPEPALVELVAAMLSDNDDLWREEAVRVLREVGGTSCAEALWSSATQEPDEYLRAEMAEALLHLSDPRGADILLDVMDGGESARTREEAWAHLRSHYAPELSFDASLSATENDGVIEALRKWVGDQDLPPE